MQACAVLERVDEKAVQKEVIKELRKYRSLKVKIQNKEEQLAEGVPYLYAVIRDSEKVSRLKVKLMERALHHSLDDIELTIIQHKYLCPVMKNDTEIYLDLAIKKDKFYEKKRSALLNIATSLGMI